MAVKGKGKQVAAESPGPGAGGASGSGGKRRKASGDAGAGPSSSSAAKRRRRAGVLQFVDDVAGVDDDYEEEEEDELELESEDDPDDGFFTGGEHVQNPSHKRTERSHPLPFLVKEEELSGDELEEFIKTRYSNSVKYAADRSYSREDDDIFPNDCALKEPTIWRVKCMVGRERQMAFCFMQKFVDLRKIGTKVPIITAFALDHIRGFVFVEAEKACDVTEACKGFCSVYVSRITSVPAAEVPSLLSSRTKPFVLSRGTWVRMKNGNYKGDLAQVVIVDDGRKKVMIKIIPRVDLHAISKKFGGAVSLKEAAVPAPRLISSQELEFFRPHIEIKRDRQTGEVFEVLDGLMFKDGFLYKKVALSSLIYWGIQPTETELLKFSSSPTNRASADDLDWLSGMYGSKKRNLPAERDMKPSSSKLKSSKTSDLKASTSTENYDDNDVFNLHDLVLYGRKDFGVIIAVEKDGFRILKGGPEGSAVTVRKQDIKKVCVDKMFTAVDHQKKTISINDTVNVVDGPFQGKQGVVKHLYLGILFIYNESESENCGFFCAQSGSCEKIRKGLGSSTTESSDFPTPMFSEPTYEQNEHRDTERPYRSTREQLFSVGQMLRIRKGPLKGYLCRVVRIFRNDVTVKLDSLLKTVTVQADLLSVPANRGDNLSGAPASKFGSQDTSFFGSEAGKTSWDNGLPSFGSDSWQPFSSSTAPVQNAGGESEADPWCKKTSAEDDSGPWGKKTNGDSDAWGKEAVSSVDGDSTPWGKETVPSAAGDSDPWGKKVVSSADGDSDPWGKKAASSAVEVWNTSAIQKEGSSSNAWDKQAGVGGSDAAGSSWDRAVVNKESAKSDNWGEACRVMDMGTGADTDPWGSKVKAVDVEGPNSWEKATVPPDSKLEDASQGWGQPKGNSTEDQTKDNVSKDVDNNRAWGSSLPVTEDGTWGKSKDNTYDGAGGAGGWDASAANWTKSSVAGDAQNEGWGKGNWSSAKSEETNNDIGNWNKAGASDQAGDSNWDKPKSFGGDGWNKGDDQNSSWNRPGNFGGRGFGRGRGRDRGQESGDFNVRNDQRSWKNSWGGDNAERPSWRSDNQVDNEGGSGGYRGRGRGGRGQYGGRGRDNGWRNGDRSDSVFGRESNSGDGAKWGGGGNWNATNPPSNQPWSSSGGTKSYGQNQPSTLNNSEDNKQSVGEQGDPWASRVSATEGKEQQNDPWSSKMTSGGAEDTSGGWDTKAKDSSFNDGGEGLQNDPWANKIGSNEGKEQENDPWASKMSSTVGADDRNGSWNTTAKSTPSKEEADDRWNRKGGNDDSKKTDTWGAGSSGGNQESSWSKPNFSLGDQEPTWNNSRFGDDDNGNNRGGFGRGNRGRGRGRNFGDGGGSSWNGGNRNDESGGGRSGEPWNRRDFDGGRGRGRGRFGRGDRNQGNNFGSGDGGSWGSGRGDGGSWGSGAGDGGSWGSGRGNGGRSGYRNWNTSGGDDQAGKSNANNSWSQNRSSPSILGQPSGDANKSSTWGAPSGAAGGGGSWGKSNEDNWNPSGGSAKEKPSWGGGSGAPPKKEDGGAEGSGSQGGGTGSTWVAVPGRELDSGLVLREARAAPGRGRRRPGRHGGDEGRQQVDGAVERVHDGPRHLARQDGEHVPRAEGQLQPQFHRPGAPRQHGGRREKERQEEARSREAPPRRSPVPLPTASSTRKPHERLRLPAAALAGGRRRRHRYAMAVILSSAAPTTLTPPAARPRRRPRSGGLAARLSGALGLAHAGAALAAPLSYEETLRLSSDSGGDGGGFALPDLDLNVNLNLDGLVGFVNENPLVVAAGVAAIALPLLLAQILGGGGSSKPYAVVSARAAYQRLLEEPDAQLVDIRPLKDAREDGTPDLKEAKKKVAAVPYNGEDKNGFLKKLTLRFKDPENTTLVILDKFDGNSGLVAELVTANGYKAAFAVKDGAEGSRGWKSSNLPWKAPAKGFSFDLGELFGDGSDGLPVTIGLAAATGLGVLAYTEIETLLQFLGSAAVVQLVVTKLLYAEDRQKTLKQIDEFFNKKVAPKELVDEIKEIGQALLPLPSDAKSQPGPATATPVAATATEAAPAAATPTPLSPYTNYPDLKPPSPPGSTTTEGPAAVNSAPVADASTESSPPRPTPRPQSPYPNYPDFKPPSSPSPSPP